MWLFKDEKISSRLLLGTALYPNLAIMSEAIKTSGTNIITVAIRRNAGKLNQSDTFWKALKKLNCNLLPNTAGCRDAKEAITTAYIARELFQTHWIKLEVIGDDYHLQPDPFELLKATHILIKEGFEVFPYCTDDLVLCQRLKDAGCRILMPWGAPIGTGKGLLNPYALQTLRARLPDITLIVDAGIGKPSHACLAMELGFDGVLLNTAIALSENPIKMASGFRDAVCAGRKAYEAGIMEERHFAKPSTNLIDTPFWQQEK